MITPAIEIPGYTAGTWDLDPVHAHVGRLEVAVPAGSTELTQRRTKAPPL